MGKIQCLMIYIKYCLIRNFVYRHYRKRICEFASFFFWQIWTTPLFARVLQFNHNKNMLGKKLANTSQSLCKAIHKQYRFIEISSIEKAMGRVAANEFLASMELNSRYIVSNFAFSWV